MSSISEELKKLLEKWELDTYIDRFEREKILKVSTLKLMTERSAECLFPEEGLRLEFSYNLSKFKECEFESQEALKEKVPLEAIPFLDILDSDDALKMKDVNFDNYLMEQTENGVLLSVKSSSETSGITTSTKVISTSGTSSNEGREISTLVSMSASQTPNASVLPQDVPVSRKRPNSEIYDLESILRGSPKGKTAIPYQEIHNELNETMRNNIADAIIAHHVKNDVNRSLPNETLKVMFNAIKELFPKEHQEIWLGNINEKREVSKGRGKLLTRFYNMRRYMTKCGLISPSNRRSGVPSENDGDNNDDLVMEDMSDEILWLKNNQEPWTKCQDLWKKTTRHRLRNIHQEKSTIHSYMNSYPGLKNKSGYLLLETDFEVIHPGSSMKLYSEWPKLSTFLMAKNDNAVKCQLEECSTPDGKKLKTLLSLSNLFPVISGIRKGKKQWRPSRQEAKESLILVVPSCADIQVELHARREKYEKFGLSLGPQAVVVGEADAPDQSYVIINTIIYEVEAPMKAFDLAFKAMFALDAAYPRESAREWIFLQKAVYGIETPHDKKLLDARVSSLLQEYELF